MRGRTCLALVVCAVLGGVVLPAGARADISPSAALPSAISRAHVYFDDTHVAPPPGLVRGPAVAPLWTPKRPLGSRPVVPLGQRRPFSSQSAAVSGAPDREVLGFVQAGEVSSGQWAADMQMNLLTTVAYFGVNMNGDGTMVQSDSGYQTWRSSQASQMINAAHAAGDRVVLTVKAFSNAAIAGISSSERNRQTAITSILGELRGRGGDGVNLDFEGFDSGVAAGFTTFVAELQQALRGQVPAQSYLTVDTYASAASGGTMYDVRGLAPYVDAFDVMAYDITSPSSTTAGPVAPLYGSTYSDTSTVAAYLRLVGPNQVILGVPYYGYKWSTNASNSCCAPGANAAAQGGASADTYAAAYDDFACALRLTQQYDGTYQEPWATWWSPAAGDPCGGNHGAWREMYYENAQSLGAKYDLVNGRGLRGIGIWSLGYDQGHSELWAEIAQKFAVSHGPAESVRPLPTTEASTSFTVCWTPVPGSEATSHTVVWSQDGSGPLVQWVDTAASCDTFFGIAGHTYSFAAQAWSASGHGSPTPPAPQATTAISSSATRATPFTSLYAVDGYGILHPASSPPLPTTATWPGWVIARGLTLDADGLGGQVLDGWGGIHPFGNAGYVGSQSAYWQGWDIARGIAGRDASSGYVLDGYGGIHPYGGAPTPQVTAYWGGWDIARAFAVRPDGVSGYVLDGYGGIHPFGGAPPISGGYAYDAHDALSRAAQGGYWRGWDIARDLVLRPDGVSGYVLDGFGGTHPFGGAPPLPGGNAYNPSDGQARCAPGAFWGGWDIARGLVLFPDAQGGYVLDGYGGFHPFGSAPSVALPNYLQRDVVRAAVIAA